MIGNTKLIGDASVIPPSPRDPTLAQWHSTPFSSRLPLPCSVRERGLCLGESLRFHLLLHPPDSDQSMKEKHFWNPPTAAFGWSPCASCLIPSAALSKAIMCVGVWRPDLWWLSSTTSCFPGLEFLDFVEFCHPAPLRRSLKYLPPSAALMISKLALIS